MLWKREEKEEKERYIITSGGKNNKVYLFQAHESSGPLSFRYFKTLQEVWQEAKSQDYRCKAGSFEMLFYNNEKIA